MLSLLRKSILKTNFTRQYNTHRIIYDNFNTILIGTSNISFLVLFKVNNERLENEIQQLKNQINSINK
jgi:hypothetical protein